MTDSRRKGANAEREVARLLEQWWKQLEPGCRFVKTPLSGGWSGPSVRADFQTSGDLTTTAKRFPWTIEVKRREMWALDRLLAGRPSPVWKWWLQACTQAAEAKRDPVLWFRKSREPWRCLGLVRTFHDGRLPGMIVAVPELYRRKSKGSRFAVMFLAEDLIAMKPEMYARETE